MKSSGSRGGHERSAHFGAAVTLAVCLAGCSSGANPGQYQSPGDDGGGSSGGGSSSGSAVASSGGSGAGAGGGSGGSRPGSGNGNGSSSSAPSSVTGAPSGDSVDGGAGEAAPGIACTPALPSVTSKTEFLCTAGGGGKCDTCADCSLVMDGTAKSQATSCGTSCIGQGDACITSCLSGKTPTLSATCQSCMVSLFDCTVKYCTGPCVTGTAAQCSACLKANPAPGPTSCDSLFLQCAGVSNNPGYSG